MADRWGYVHKKNINEFRVNNQLFNPKTAPLI
jgi:hypothetical protein